MNTSTTSIINLSFSDKKYNHTSRCRHPHHVYLSQYFLQLKLLSKEGANEIMLNNTISTAETISWYDSSSSFDSFVFANNKQINALSTQQIARIASKYWRHLPIELKDAWKVRTKRLNTRPVNDSSFSTTPTGIASALEKNILNSLGKEWVGIVKRIKWMIKKTLAGTWSVVVAQ